jgi:uncharacterized protein YoxC
MSTLEHDTLAKACAVAKQLLLDIQPKLAGLAQIFDSVGGVKETLTQAELDEVAALSGLTVDQVSDGLYVLTTLLLPAIQQGYPALAQLAARFL